MFSLINISLLLLILLVSNTWSVGSTEVLTGKYFKVNNIEAVYQLPSSTTTIKGVVFLAHGCSHSATDWWPKSDSCPLCIGLPVEMSIVRYGLEHGYVMLAMSSTNRRHKCWTGHDLNKANTLITYFYQKIILSAIPETVSVLPPLHMLGASSGGNFVGILSQHRSTSDQPRVSSINVQISSIQEVDINKIPPTIFSLMIKDSFTLSTVRTNVLSRIDQHSIIEVPDLPITDSYFYDHTYGSITLEDSKKIAEVFYNQRLIDSRTKKLLNDPRMSEWRSVSLYVSLSDVRWVDVFYFTIGGKSCSSSYRSSSRYIDCR